VEKVHLKATEIMNRLINVKKTFRKIFLFCFQYAGNIVCV
jgi:hypothetical protein